MKNRDKFIEHINKGYAFKGPSITIGAAMLDGEPQSEAHVKLALKTFNRHGLIAGATGTGKTKTLQIISEALSDQGVPVMLMDIKGDLSGLAAPGNEHPKILERHEKIDLPYQPGTFPIEVLSISDEQGASMRATVSEFGPILMSRILGLNDTQSGVMAMIFKYCDDKGYPLLDIKDLKKTLQYVIDEGKDEIREEYGYISPATIGSISRKIIELESQGAEKFFGEKSFDIDDLMRTDKNGHGIISILRLTDIQDRPKLFSAFMLSLLAELYATMPESGDSEKPHFVMFIDEAHLIFDRASDALLDQIEMIIKLIRSKGVGIFFCTQLPTDIPEKVLSQLGLRVQHALRAVTAKDRRSIKQTSENFPLSDYYETNRVITSLGIGEALVTGLNEKGIPTPLAATYLVAPRSRMGVLTPKELKDEISNSKIIDEYNKEIDRESAYEILKKKIEEFADDDHQKDLKKGSGGKKRGNYSENDGMTIIKELSKNTMVRQLGRTVMRELARGLLGAMGVKTSSRSQSSSSRKKTTTRKKR